MDKRRGLDELGLGFSRARRQPDLDPSSLDEPWSSYVEHALDGHEHFVRLVEDLPRGPLQDELLDLKPQVELAVDRVWHVAKLGNDISEELPSDETGSLADAASAARAELDALQEEFDRVLARTAGISLARTPGGAGRAESKMTRVLDRLEALDAALAEVRSDVLPTNGSTRPSVRLHRARRPLVAAGVGAIVVCGVVSAVLLSSAPSSRSCASPTQPQFGGEIALPSELAVPTDDTYVPLKDVSGGDYGLSAEMVQLQRLGATDPARQQVLNYPDGAQVQVLEIAFPNPSAATTFAAGGTRQMCSLATSSFAPSGIPTGVGIEENSPGQLPQVWVVALAGRYYVRGQVIWKDMAAARTMAAQAVRWEVQASVRGQPVTILGG